MCGLPTALCHAVGLPLREELAVEGANCGSESRDPGTTTAEEYELFTRTYDTPTPSHMTYFWMTCGGAEGSKCFNLYKAVFRYMHRTARGT